MFINNSKIIPIPIPMIPIYNKKRTKRKKYRKIHQKCNKKPRDPSRSIPQSTSPITMKIINLQSTLTTELKPTNTPYFLTSKLSLNHHMANWTHNHTHFLNNLSSIRVKSLNKLVFTQIAMKIYFCM